MGLWRRLVGTDDATMAHRVILVWNRARPDMQAEIDKLPNETPAQQEIRATLRGFLDKTESRLIARAHEPMAAQGRRFVKKTETVQVEET